MRTKVSAGRAETELLLYFPAALYVFILFLLSTFVSGVWVVAADDRLRMPVFSPEWANEKFKVTTNETVGCTGRGTDGYIWRNVGWGSNTNCE